MAVNRGQLIGLNYQLPGQEQMAGGTGVPSQAAPNFNNGVGDPAESLQQVDGATEDYFKKWAMLKSFAHDAEQNLGINVQAPDYSRPESIQLNRIYNKALADLKYQGNLLKTSQQMLAAGLNRGDIFNTDPTQQAVATMRPGQDFMPDEADPLVTQANSVLNQPYYGDTIKQAEQFYEEKYNQMTELAKKQPERAEYWLRQRDILVKPRKAVREFNPFTYQQRSAGDTRKLNAAGKFLTKVTNFINGSTQGFTPSKTELQPDGTPYLVNNDYKGIKYGGSRVSVARSDGQNTEFILESGEIVPLTGEDPMSVARSMLGENSTRFGVDADYLDQWAEDNQMFNDDGTINKELLLAPDADDVKKNNLKNIQNAKPIIQDQVQKLVNDLSSLEGHWWKSNDEKSFPLKGGGEAVVTKPSAFSKNYTIANIEELFPVSSFKNEASAKAFWKEYRDMSLESLKEFLVAEGAHLQYAAQPPVEAQPTQQPQVGTTQPNAPTLTPEEAARAETLRLKYGIK